MDEDTKRVGQTGKLPGPKEVDAGVRAAARTGQSEGKAAKGGGAEVFKVRADVDAAGW